MEMRQINPWTWQDRFGSAQAWRVDAPGSLVFVAGQGPISEEGELVGAGDFERSRARRSRTSALCSTKRGHRSTRSSS
jgi:hypothetical protein